jgi:hypothetical protein
MCESPFSSVALERTPPIVDTFICMKHRLIKSISVMAPSELPTLLTRNEAAEFGRVCTETIKRWEQGGALIALKSNDRITRYRREDVLKAFGIVN